MKQLKIPKYLKINKNTLETDKLVLSGVFLLLLIVMLVTNFFRNNIEITAHRGASSVYPENTFSAFKEAKELGADWIELDVQQTKDKKLIIMHDANLLRVAGIDQNIWESNYDEISAVDVGAFFSGKYINEKIPLLEDVIKYAKKEKIKLNIELKPTGNEVDLEKSVINLLKKYNYTKKCVIASFSYDVIKKVKELDKSITTTYISFEAIDKIDDYKDADAFSIYSGVITKDLVDKIHKSQKKINAWTPDTKEEIKNMVDLKVDNIITDDVELAKEVLGRK